MEPALVELDRSNMASLPCCGVKDSAHPGRRRKECWCEKYFDKGLRAKVLLTPDNRQCGYIEYLPGEYAWRGVKARGYLFINCIWTFFKQYQHKGLAAAMLRACVEDARQAGMKGAAVLARNRPWLAGPAVFLKNGFEVVDTAPPDYQLLAHKFKPSSPSPSFSGGWERKLAKYGSGLTIIQSSQCPHTTKFAAEIAETAEKEYGLKPNIVDIASPEDARAAPTPYAVFAVIYNGCLLADHQVSRTRFRNLMGKLVSPANRGNVRTDRKPGCATS